MSLFSSRFYKYLTKYMKLIAQKKQLARILEILGTFRSFLSKKQAFSQKMGAVMPIVWSLITIVIDPPFWHPSPLEMLLIPQENSLFISTFNVVKKALPLLPMLFNNPHFWKGIVMREGKKYNWIKLSISSSLANS